ncbi:hypothetical protein QJQ45_026752 [Haematococcus lacustris]|nr:hypothetical protein QJQ45_026752 [Haematococcus lacustris]
MVSSPIVAASSRLFKPAAFFRWGYAVLTERFKPPGSSGYPRRFGFWRELGLVVVEHAIALGTKAVAGQHQKDVLKLEHRGGDNMHQSVTLVVHASPLSRTSSSLNIVVATTCINR